MKSRCLKETQSTRIPTPLQSDNIDIPTDESWFSEGFASRHIFMIERRVCSLELIVIHDEWK